MGRSVKKEHIKANREKTDYTKLVINHLGQLEYVNDPIRRDTTTQQIHQAM